MEEIKNHTREFKHIHVSILLDEETIKRIDEFFAKNPGLKKSGFFAEAVKEKLEKVS